MRYCEKKTKFAKPTEIIKFKPIKGQKISKMSNTSIDSHFVAKKKNRRRDVKTEKAVVDDDRARVVSAGLQFFRYKITKIIDDNVKEYFNYRYDLP